MELEPRTSAGGSPQNYALDRVATVLPSTLNITCNFLYCNHPQLVAYPGIFCGGAGFKNSVEDRGQRERGSGGCSPLVTGFTQFVNEQNPYSNQVVTDYIPRNWEFTSAFSKLRNFGEGGVEPHKPPPPGYAGVHSHYITTTTAKRFSAVKYRVIKKTRCNHLS
jgi:hypothetical protein